MDQSPGFSDNTAAPFITDTGRATLIHDALQAVYAKCLPLNHGAVADYIPELAAVDPDQFGICIATADGAIYEAGDSQASFTIQSISKAFVYGLALEGLGRDPVLGHVGVEPSGEPFNAIEFDQRSNRPFNPMVNAGAIATTSLIDGPTPDARLRRLLEMFERYCGRPLELNEAVFRSELETGHRNRAIAYLMLNGQMIAEPIAEHLNLYFQQCSITVTARDLAVMAATLAAGGRNPLTGAQALSEEHVRHVIAVMYSCGMYDYSGEWGFRVGLPAKSGVGGGIIAVLPGQFGIGVFSPRLDSNGNSVRGIAVCEELSHRFGLHIFDAQTMLDEVVRRTLRGDVIRSNRMRDAATTATLDRLGRGIWIIQLQGSLYMAAVERLLRQLDSQDEPIQHLILDLRHVSHVDAPAAALLVDLAGRYAGAGRTTSICTPERRVAVGAALADAGFAVDAMYVDVDAALEAAEERLLSMAGADVRDDVAFDLSQQALFKGLTGDDLAVLAAAARRTHYAPGEQIIREGEKADRFFLLAKGRVSVRLNLGAGRSKRLAAMNAGVCFGEMALLSGAARTADVVADEAVECYEVGLEALAELAYARPAIQMTLLTNLGRLLADRLRKANNEIRMLEV